MTADSALLDRARRLSEQLQASKSRLLVGLDGEQIRLVMVPKSLTSACLAHAVSTTGIIVLLLLAAVVIWGAPADWSPSFMVVVLFVVLIAIGGIPSLVLAPRDETPLFSVSSDSHTLTVYDGTQTPPTMPTSEVRLLLVLQYSWMAAHSELADVHLVTQDQSVKFVTNAEKTGSTMSAREAAVALAYILGKPALYVKSRGGHRGYHDQNIPLGNYIASGSPTGVRYSLADSVTPGGWLDLRKLYAHIRKREETALRLGAKWKSVQDIWDVNVLYDPAVPQDVQGIPSLMNLQ